MQRCRVYLRKTIPQSNVENLPSDGIAVGFRVATRNAYSSALLNTGHANV
jgi:hypothetical protein